MRDDPLVDLVRFGRRALPRELAGALEAPLAEIGPQTRVAEERAEAIADALASDGSVPATVVVEPDKPAALPGLGP